MSEEFVPTSLDVALGGTDDTPPAEVVEVEEKPAEEAETKSDEAETKVETKDDEVKQDKQDNVIAMRELIASQSKELKTLKKVEPKPAPDVIDDPDGFREHLTKEFDGKLSKNKAEMSESMARQQFKDYDTVAERFYKELEASPEIGVKIQNSSHPAMALYEQGQKLLELDEIGDPKEFKAKMKAEILAELKDETNDTATKKDEEKASLKAKLPDDLTSESNAGTRVTKVKFEPTSLDALFPD